jgi:hydrogenase expression/formation protein HypE
VGSRADDTRRLSRGKLPLELLGRLLGSLPPGPPEVRLGARVGEDACAIDVPAGVLVVAADPITLTSAEAGRLSVIVNANDVAVSGARPRWFLAVVLVPPGTGEALVTQLFDEIRRALDDLGAHLVGGHTEITPAVTRPIVIGQMLGLAEAGEFLTTSGLGPGDVIVQVRPAPIEGAAVLARESADQLDEMDATSLEAARSALERPGIGVVEAALLAARLGVNALHDPTEGGLASGLHEMAEAGGVRIEVDRGAVLWFAPGVAVCRAFGADPWSTLASGTLLGAFPPERVDAALAAFAAEGHPSAVIGTVSEGTGVFDTRGEAILWPERDEVARILSGGETPDADTAAGTI